MIPLFVMKRLLMFVCMALTLTAVAASCATDEEPVVPSLPGNTDDDISAEPDDGRRRLNIRVGDVPFRVLLENNESAEAFKALLPVTVNMSDMNGNEKYYYLPESLPVAASAPGTIRTGDLMLYGSGCLVLFYKTFSTSYSYTRLGYVEDPSGLAAALGEHNITVTFELQ